MASGLLEELHDGVERLAVFAESAGGDDNDVHEQVEDEDQAAYPEEHPGPHARRLPETGPYVGRLARFTAQESPFLSYFLRPST